MDEIHTCSPFSLLIKEYVRWNTADTQKNRSGVTKMSKYMFSLVTCIKCHVWSRFCVMLIFCGTHLSFLWEYLLSFVVGMILTNLLSPWSWALLEKPSVMQLLKNFPTYYGTWRFITVFTRALHRSLSWARQIQFIPLHRISLRSILSLSIYVLVFLVVSFLLAFPPTSYMHSSSPHAWVRMIQEWGQCDSAGNFKITFNYILFKKSDPV
jgi:hypothetical protein